MNKIITVGREFGSGGREFGYRLAETLGYAYCDQEIVSEIVNRTAFSERYIQQILERKPTISFPIHIGRTLHTVPSPMLEQSTLLYHKQCEVIREMAEKSNCVIVGRCADHILRERHPFRFFVYADIESRIKRCREKEPEHENLTDRELRKRILDVDRQRSRYYGFYTDHTWGDRINYDLCINTTNTSIREIATALSMLFMSQMQE